MTARYKICALAFLSLLGGAVALGDQITWSGRQWTVRNGTGGPGPNAFSASNVSVDSDGVLHLQIKQTPNGWTCAEINGTEALGYGTYEFELASRVDQLDRNIVLGLFNYPKPSTGPDGTNEIDIEFSHWGATRNPIGNYTVWPAELGTKNVHHTFDMPPAASTIGRFTWQEGSVLLATRQLQEDEKPKDIAVWQTPQSFARNVGHVPMPMHLNLWLFKGRPPSDGKNVEILVRSFRYTQ